jgi:hypothetical protein
MFVVVLLLIRRLPRTDEAGIDNIGILPSMWMAYKHPQLQTLFLQVVEPTIDNLRTMGMVEMQLADETPPFISGSTNGGYHSVSFIDS